MIAVRISLAFLVGFLSVLFSDRIAPAQEARNNTVSFLKANGELTARLPVNPKNALGWTIRVQTSPSMTADVMRVEIEFASTLGPTTADQNFVVRMVPLAQGHSPPDNAMVVTLPLEIAEGSDRIRFVRHVPKATYGNLYQVQVMQDGREVPDCRATIGEAITYPDSAVYANVFAQNRLSLLWVNHDADRDSRTQSLKHFYLSSDINPYYASTDPATWAQEIDRVRLADDFVDAREADVDDLPSQWLGYRPFDTIVIHREDYERFRKTESSQSRALRSWNQAGGILIVRGGSVSDPTKRIIKDQSSETGSIPSLEALNAAQNFFKQRAADYLQYREPDNVAFQSEIQYMDLTEEQIRQWKNWLPEAAQIIKDSLDQFPPAQVVSVEGVRAEGNLAGMIIHLGKQDPRSAIEMLQWNAAIYLMGWKVHRLTRSGVEPILGSSRFFQWVIPGVAQPPVYTFMGLLGVFVILVGPVAYRKTAKSGRSYLMFAIAPVLAIATTLAMLAYGVIADGFGTQTRIRQVTWIDGQTGDGFTRTRSTYFAGIRPADGLAFPADADVTLYPDNQQRSWESRVEDRFQIQGEVIHNGETIRLNQDFLPSRQQRQFVTHRPHSNLGRVVFESNDAIANESPSEEKAGTVQIRNDFPQPITELIVCDARGEYFFVERVDGGQVATGIGLTDKEASERLGEMYKRQWLVSSIVDRRQNQTNSMRNSSNEMFDLLGSQVNELDTIAKPVDGVFEFELQIRMQLGSRLPNMSFLGLMELTDDAIAVGGAVPTESIHFVMGSMP